MAVESLGGTVDEYRISRDEAQENHYFNSQGDRL